MLSGEGTMATTAASSRHRPMNVESSLPGATAPPTPSIWALSEDSDESCALIAKQIAYIAISKEIHNEPDESIIHFLQGFRAFAAARWRAAQRAQTLGP